VPGELRRRLPLEDLNPDAGPAVEPGTLRTREVSVGHHIAPAWQAVLTFLTRWAEMDDGDSLA
jgi:hypothetical protein